jgi:hypothetical protein
MNISSERFQTPTKEDSAKFKAKTKTFKLSTMAKSSMKNTKTRGGMDEILQCYHTPPSEMDPYVYVVLTSL